MPIYRIIGVDQHHNQQRTLYVIADAEGEARALVEGRAISVNAASVVSEADVPPGAGMLRVPAPPPPPLTREQRRLRLMMLGVGIALIIIIGTVFVLRASRHLARRAPAPPPVGDEEMRVIKP